MSCAVHDDNSRSATVRDNYLTRTGNPGRVLPRRRLPRIGLRSPLVLFERIHQADEQHGAANPRRGRRVRARACGYLAPPPPTVFAPPALCSSGVVYSTASSWLGQSDRAKAA